MTIEFTPTEIQNLLQFLLRSQMSGQEVGTYVALMSKLEAALKAPNAEAAAPISELVG